MIVHSLALAIYRRAGLGLWAYGVGLLFQKCSKPLSYISPQHLKHLEAPETLERAQTPIPHGRYQNPYKPQTLYPSLRRRACYEMAEKSLAFGQPLSCGFPQNG